MSPSIASDAIHTVARNSDIEGINDPDIAIIVSDFLHQILKKAPWYLKFFINSLIKAIHNSSVWTS